MRFFQSVFAAAAFVSAALAAPAINSISPDGPYQVGQTYTIVYTANAPVTLKLRQGASDNLQDVAVLTSTGTAGSYSWTVDKSLPNGANYAIQIIDSTGNNYWGPITISGSTATASSSAASSASSAASSSASASKSGSTTVGSTLTTAASASVSSSARANSTISSATLSASSTGATLSATASRTGSASATGSSGAPQSTGAASQMGSSMALVLGAVAAMAYLN